LLRIAWKPAIANKIVAMKLATANGNGIQPKNVRYSSSSINSRCSYNNRHQRTNKNMLLVNFTLTIAGVSLGKYARNLQEKCLFIRLVGKNDRENYLPDKLK
jgi:hypothetical protein